MKEGYAFEVKGHDALGRLGVFTTPHGKVPTPALLPVVNPNIPTVTPAEMAGTFGARMIITNSYIISRTPGLREKALESGLHRLLDFDGPVMTDSGTFQMYFYDQRGAGAARGGVDAGDLAGGGEGDGGGRGGGGGAGGGGRAGGGGGGGGAGGGGRRRIDIDPLEIVRFQRDIGSDVGTILDVFSTPDRTRDESAADAALTLERARVSVPESGAMGLALPVQGGVHRELRRACARDMYSLDAVLHPVGGIVPIMESYRYDLLADIVLAARDGLSPGRPVHLFGCGHPMLMPLAAAMGCDLFDSSAYAKYASGGRMLFRFGTRRLDELPESPCACPVCSRHGAGGLREMEGPERERNLALHNLHVSFAELRNIRCAISEGSLWELVEERNACHPGLFLAFRRLLERWRLIERFEPTSKRRYMASTPLSAFRPEMGRFYTRLTGRYRPAAGEAAGGLGGTLLLIPGGSTPLSRPFRAAIGTVRERGGDVAFHTPLGPVPPELDEMYPFGQCVLPEKSSTVWDAGPGGANPRDDREGPADFDYGSADESGPSCPGYPSPAADRLEAYCAANGFSRRIVWTGEPPLKELLDLLDPSGGSAHGVRDEAGGKDAAGGGGTGVRDSRDLLRVRAVCDMQFGPGSLELLSGGPDAAGSLRFNRSRNTGKLRTVEDGDGNHLLSMRAEDGLMILRAAAARNLHASTRPPVHRVVVDDDSAPFNRDGKSVFAKFVKECDPNVRPGDEVLVVTGADELVAVGRALMNREEMLSFDSGMAVDVREGVGPRDRVAEGGDAP